MVEDVHINAQGNIIDILKQMKAGFEANSKSVDAFQNTATGSLNKIDAALKSVSLASLQQNIQSLNQGFEDLNGPGLKFNTSLKELSALTGTSGADLEKLGEKARASAKEFGGNAASSLNTYKTILGRLGPDIAKDQAALDGMEKNVQVLSKTMEGDAAGAVDALTTAMLQYGVDLSKPKEAQREMAKMMDVMANAAQEGAAEVPQISAALKVSGVAATQAKVSFIETNAAIQALAQGGKEGSEAGMALRNVLGKMAGEDVLPKEAAEKLKKLGVDMRIVSDTSIPFTDRLRELRKAQGDATIMAQVFGTENAAAANILLSSVDAQDQLVDKIGKVGGAQAQANVVMESASEKLARIQAKIDDAKNAFFEYTGGMTAYLGPATKVMQTVVAFAPVLNVAKIATIALFTAEGQATIARKASTVVTTVKTAAMKVATAAQWLWNKATMANTTAAKGLSESIGKVGKESTGTSGSMGKLGAALKGVGWAAIAAGIAIVAQRIYDVASGAVEVQANLAAIKAGNAAGTKKGEAYSNEHLGKMNTDIEAARNLQIAGEITEKEYRKREMESRRIASVMIKNDIATNNILRENRVKSLKEQRQHQYDREHSFIGGEGVKQLFGATSEADITAKRRGAVTEVDASTKVLMEALRTNESELNRVKAEEKGAGKLGTPIGYTPKESKSDKVMSGAGEVKRIDVRIDTLVKEININTTNLKEGLGEIRKQVAEAIIGGVRDFEVAI